MVTIVLIIHFPKETELRSVPEGETGTYIQQMLGFQSLTASPFEDVSTSFSQLRIRTAEYIQTIPFVFAEAEMLHAENTANDSLHPLCTTYSLHVGQSMERVEIKKQIPPAVRNTVAYHTHTHTHNLWQLLQTGLTGRS